MGVIVENRILHKQTDQGPQPLSREQITREYSESERLKNFYMDLYWDLRYKIEALAKETRNKEPKERQK